MIWHKSSYHWLLRLRTYEGVDWLYKRKSLQGYNIINFKFEGNIHLLKFLSVPCCWSWLTLLWHLLCYCSHHWFIQSQLWVYLYMFPFLTFYILLFSRILITSPCSASYIFVSWSLCKISLHTGSSFHVILKKKLFSSHPVSNRGGFSWKQFSKI